MYLQKKSWILALVIACHLVAVFFLLPSKPERGRDVSDWSAPVFIELKRPPEVQLDPPQASVVRPRTTAPPPPRAEVAIMSPASAPLPAAETSIDVNAIILSAKRDAGAIDRELRKQSFDKASDSVLSSDSSRFAKAIGKAFKPRGTRIIEYELPDGRRASKVSGPIGTYCVAALDNHTIMADSFRAQGFNTRPTGCPSEDD
jgi:hypothetical protein